MVERETPRPLRIAGQAPGVKWKSNQGRKRRTIDAALALARKRGITIPDDVEFIESDEGDLVGSLAELRRGGFMETAKGPWIEEHADGYVYWSDHYNRHGKIPFRLHPDILSSDEAIVAVITHELFELEEFRKIFMSSKKRRMNATDYGIQSAPGHSGNFHDLAWEAADQAVLRLRRRK